jgi:hypothetical protein
MNTDRPDATFDAEFIPAFPTCHAANSPIINAVLHAKLALRNVALGVPKAYLPDLGPSQFRVLFFLTANMLRSSLPSSVSKVIGLIAKEKVSRIDAPWIITRVAHVHA